MSIETRSELLEIEYAINALLQRTETAMKELQSAQVRVHQGDKNSGKDALWAVYYLWNSKEYTKLEEMFKP